MKVEIFPDDQTVAETAAALIVDAAREAVAARGRFVMAVSGGRTPWKMLHALADMTLPWEQLHIVQVDERIAPHGDKDRNLTHLVESLGARAAELGGRIHAMPVEAEDPAAAAWQYAETLGRLCGGPPIIDLVHLGLGPDGHTASLIPGDPVLEKTDVDVALTGVYQGRRRMTLTYPILNRARRILWLVTGADKVTALAQLRAGDHAIPAGRVRQEQAVLLADTAAAG